jgi:hypothetical protein
LAGRGCSVMVDPGWVKIKDGGTYGGVSGRTFRDWTKNGLRYVRLPSGTILVKIEWIDEFLEGFAVQEDEVDKVVNNVIKDLGID